MKSEKKTQVQLTGCMKIYIFWGLEFQKLSLDIARFKMKINKNVIVKIDNGSLKKKVTL